MPNSGSYPVNPLRVRGLIRDFSRYSDSTPVVFTGIQGNNAFAVRGDLIVHPSERTPATAST
jgi:hypothetical protein